MASTEWVPRSGGGVHGGGTLHYRFRVPAKQLVRAGHVVVIGTLCGKQGVDELLVRPWDEETCRFSNQVLGGFDVVILQRYMRADLLEHVGRARAAGQKVVNDVDDWFDGLPKSNRAWWTTHPSAAMRLKGLLEFDFGIKPSHRQAELLLAGKGEQAVCRALPTWQHARVFDVFSEAREAPRDNRDHYRDLIRASDALIVSTPFLAERYRSMQVPTYVLRNAADLAGWDTEEQRDTTEPVVGWYGSLGHRSSGDFEILRSFLPQWLRGHPDCRFVWGGATRNLANVPEAIRLFGLQGLEDRMEARPGVPPAELRRLLRGIDVGLVPLWPAQFNEAKSWIKVAEFGAAGIPSVASASAENLAFGVADFAMGPGEWLDHLEGLRDPLTRAVKAQEARARAEEVSIERTWRDWQDAFEQIRAGAYEGAFA